MKGHSSDITASVKAKLLNISRASGTEHTVILRRYAQERFLFRLSTTEHKRKLILKGALLYLVFRLDAFRPTKDIDLLGTSISNDHDQVSEIVSDVACVAIKDGITFSLPTSVEDIMIANSVSGTRVQIPWNMGRTRGKLQLDIGFGDIQVKGPLEMRFPTLLETEEPSVMSYSLETALAEKFQIIASLNYGTSRMKDFYDINQYCSQARFSSRELLASLEATFGRRNTPLGELQTVFSERFINDDMKASQWETFLARSRASSKHDFRSVMRRIIDFVVPLMDTEKVADLTWSPEDWTWK
jgi:predicted nucleotidyltransferase component of viral defense system